MKALPSLMNGLNIKSNETAAGGNDSSPSRTTIDNRLVYLAAVMLPYEHMQYVVKQKAKNVAEFMMRDGIKFKNKDVVSMTTIVERLDDMVRLLQRTPEVSSTTRLQAGLILRGAKDMWVTLMVVAAVSLIRKQHNNRSPPVVDWRDRSIQWYETIVHGMGLDGCWTTKPLMNGKDLIRFLGIPIGPSVGVYTEEQIQWMLMNPDGTSEQLQVFLKSFQKEREREEDQAAQHISKKMHL
jgi:hypothetical protein